MAWLPFYTACTHKDEKKRIQNREKYTDRCVTI